MWKTFVKQKTIMTDTFAAAVNQPHPNKRILMTTMNLKKKTYLLNNIFIVIIKHRHVLSN